MIRLPLIAVAAALVAAPATAQTAPSPAPVVAPADPAAVSEARLVVRRLLPPGIYKQILGPMMDPIMASMSDGMKAVPLRKLAELGGMNTTEAAALDKVRVEEVMAIYDPHWQERMRLSTRAMVDAMGDFFTTLEPEMREAMAQAYARRFTAAELTDLNRFFATPSGAKFAGQYMTIMTDPSMAAEMRSMMPKMIQHMPQFIDASKKATASLPPPRKVQDLTPAEKTTLAKALGVDESKLHDPKGPL